MSTVLLVWPNSVLILVMHTVLSYKLLETSTGLKIAYVCELYGP